MRPWNRWWRVFKHVPDLRFALLGYYTKKIIKHVQNRFSNGTNQLVNRRIQWNVLDIKFTYLKHNKTEEDKPKYLKFLQSDIRIPETTTTTLQQLFIKCDQRNTAATPILLLQQITVDRTPFPARVITQVPVPLSLWQNIK